ncbi:vacuolar protein sorting-associated protein 35 [Wallemia mellicola]|nr:vacuolar protein sorting-associated protein 35 [Wallemia mellicola]TIC25472.1 vacuolar protein sorting-associated protein 35 [Wallemia mellicola]
MDEPKLLTEALNAVKTSQIQMKKCLDADELMDAFKSASSMLSELRTSSLGPKAYYELYIAVFDSLRHLSSYLYDAHLSGKHHLADLYELVQYASNIIPRLYLMITVASVYMSTPDAPIKEIMKDILEMSRGVQHPIRGLFLRHYLSGQTRDYLPISVSDSGNGSLNDSIAFILTNFIEMNKLWVRLQHQGHSRDKERRELERKELRILVGTNLVRLSQLEEIDLATYQSLILPNILEQVVNCRDVIAQDYLMEVVIQVFPDEFQLNTLGPFLAAAAQLNTRVNIKQVVISLIDRLSMYAKRESEMQSTEEIAKQDEETNKKLEDKVKARRSGQEYVSESPTDKKGKGREEDPSKKYRGIPQSVKLFEVFWEQIVNLIETRPDLSIQDITALLVSLASLSLNCYPDKLEYVDQVLSFTKAKLDTIPQHSPQTINNVLALLRAPITSYKSMITLLALPSYLPLMQLQPYQSRKYIAIDICNSLLNNATIIESPDDVKDILELCQVLIKEGSYEDEDIAIEQASLTRLLHLFKSDDKEVQFELLKTARDQLGEGKRRVQFTFPTLITLAIKLSKVLANDDIFKFIHQSIFQLHVLTDHSDECMRLFLLATRTADEAKLKEMTYEFFSEALLLIEEDIISSKYQMQGIASATKTLQKLTIFVSNPDEYQVLANKLVNMSAKLLKKSHQAESLIIASSVFWQAEGGIRNGSSIKAVLERASRIASTLIDPVTTTQIYVDILDAYLMYLDMEVEEISTSVVSDAVQLISGNLDSMEEANKHPISVALRAPSVVDVKLTSANVTSQFKRSIAHIHSKRNYTPKWNEIDVAGPSLRFGIN